MILFSYSVELKVKENVKEKKRKERKGEAYLVKSK